MSNSSNPGHVKHFVSQELDQTVCKGYQQMKLVDKELTTPLLTLKVAQFSHFKFIFSLWVASNIHVKSLVRSGLKSFAFRTSSLEIPICDPLRLIQSLGTDLHSNL